MNEQTETWKGQALRAFSDLAECQALLQDMIKGIDRPHVAKHLPTPLMGWEEWEAKTREVLKRLS